MKISPNSHTKESARGKITRLALLPCIIILLSQASNYCRAQTNGPLILSSPGTTGNYTSNVSVTLATNFTSTAPFSASIKLIDCIPYTNNFSQSQNFILVTTAKVAGYTNAGQLTGQGTCQLMQTVQYFDGIGRPVQTVQVKGSPFGYDVVQPIVYDAFGREVTKYLPYALSAGTSDGSYKTDALTPGAGQSQFYNRGGSGATQQASGVVNTAYPFAANVLEASPLSRVTEQGAPGATWQPGSGHTVKKSYGANGVGEVTLWMVNTAGNGLTGGDKTYSPNALVAVTTTDENGYNSIEYKDKQGRMVCKKVQSTTTVGSYISTCYVYNDLGNLSYVIPPNPSGAAYPATILETDATFKNYIYSYRYDERNRLIRKKIPGKGWEYMVYNRLDQIVLSQDSIQRATNVWTVTKYDAQGRVILTGTWPSTGQDQSTLQSNIYAGAQWDVRDYSNNTTGYNIVSYAAPNKILTINYYDDYNNIPGMPTAFVVSGYSANTRGLLTATRTSVLNSLGNTTPDVLYAAHYYDDLGRNIRTYQQHYLGGATALSQYNYDVITNGYNFSNQDTSTMRQHYRNVSNAASLSVTVANTYGYDHAGRKTQTFEKINTGTNVLLAQSDFNEIGQLMAKHLHSATGAAPFLQDISYKYNERGWLKRINDPAMTPTTTRLFAEQLNYDSLKYSAPTLAMFNGNIAEQDYFTNGGARQHVVYEYDPLSRLTAGTNSAGWSETGIQYDNLGNIKQLIRGTNTGLYAYNGNQLTSVTGITTSNYGYDPNGNVSHEGRNNATIGYNMLNLPQTVTATTPVAINITYTYDAGGTKLRKVSNGVSTDYIGGIQYKPDAATIDFIQTEDGRAVPITGGYEYQYVLSDHLGNNRVTFGTKTGAAVKLQVDDYYPFGLDANSFVTSPQNKYLYNNKELQEELGQYDYGSRFYDPVVGRFNMIDRFAEKYAVISPYQYGANDPIRNLDVAGDSIIVTVNARDDKKLWDSFHTLAKTPLGKIFLDKYISSNTFDIYVTKSAEDSRAVFNTFANIERRGDVVDGKIELKSPENKKIFKGLEGHKVKPKHVSAVTAINTTQENKITKYDIAAAIFHEIIAHIEGELTDFDPVKEHQNYGAGYVPTNGIYTEGSEIPNVIEGGLAWMIAEQLIQLKIQEGNGTAQDKSDLKKMLEADKKRKAEIEQRAHQNH